MNRRSFIKRLGILAGAALVIPKTLLVYDWKTYPGKIKFRQYGKLSPVTTPLCEGVVPAGSKLSYTEGFVSASEYFNTPMGKTVLKNTLKHGFKTVERFRFIT